jgi:hypothetical protein
MRIHHLPLAIGMASAAPFTGETTFPLRPAAALIISGVLYTSTRSRHTPPLAASPSSVRGETGENKMRATEMM